MKAISITTYGDPEVLVVKEVPTPEPGNEEVLIEVRASGLNRSDVFQRKGHYPAPPGATADIPGLEAAGVVVGCGPNVTMWKPGEKVCALVAGGGYAEYLTVKEGQCLPVPDGWSFLEAAGLPETVLTVWSNVFERGELRPAETLLVHGGSSGIGITAIQIAHALGSRVVVTVGTDEKGRNCLALGASSFINYKTQDFEAVLKEEGVDVVLDMVGGDYFQKNLNILKPGGRLVYINAVGGDTVSLGLWQVMRKRLTITGSTLRNREYEFKKRLTRTVYEHVWPVIAAGKFRPVIYKTFPYQQAATAHRLLEQNLHTGKIILEWNSQ
jgi:putative PIG3 family NAD(P)H quinone oxidoreductase